MLFQFRKPKLLVFLEGCCSLLLGQSLRALLNCLQLVLVEGSSLHGGDKLVLLELNDWTAIMFPSNSALTMTLLGGSPVCMTLKEAKKILVLCYLGC
jgi:hypothetical protein